MIDSEENCDFQYNIKIFDILPMTNAVQNIRLLVHSVQWDFYNPRCVFPLICNSSTHFKRLREEDISKNLQTKTDSLIQ